METGREFSLVTGYMINNRNDDTDYDTGNELHVDVMFNQFFSETFVLGLHGYYYRQVGSDSGSGAILGGFKGESYGIGPSFLWVPASGGGKFSVTGTLAPRPGRDKPPGVRLCGRDIGLADRGRRMTTEMLKSSTITGNC